MATEEPTTPPTAAAGVSRDDRPIRLEALRLAVQTIEHAPYPDEKVVYAHLADTVAVMAERYRVFLEGGTR